MAVSVKYNYVGILIESSGAALTLSSPSILDTDPSDNLAWLALPSGSRPASILYYLNGADTIKCVGAFNDQITLGTGDDLVFAGEGSDTVRGGAGADEIYGEGGNDRLSGGVGDDQIYGGEGDDIRLGGDQGNDFISGGNGKDKIRGDQGDDELQGDAGDDNIGGDAGDDYLFGGIGNDTLSGGIGDDELQGDAGADVLAGGLGYDAFYYELASDSTAALAGRDTIMDFQQGFDTIQLGDIMPLTYKHTAAFSAAGQVRVSQVGADVLVEVNTVGAGVAEMAILVKNQTTAQFSAADFFLG